MLQYNPIKPPVLNPDKQYASIKLLKIVNSREQCSSVGCHKNRTGVSKYCNKHYHANMLNGHPLGRRLSPKTDYGYELQLARAFIEEHLNHVGIGQALSFLSNWLSNDTNPLSHLESKRLSSNGVTALEVLIESTAVFLMARLQPNLIPTSEALTLAIANGVLHLTPLESYYTWANGIKSKVYYRVSGKTRRAIGKVLTDNLRLLHVNISSTIEGQLQAKEEFKMNYLKPFH
jgi:hypothetical protein